MPVEPMPEFPDYGALGLLGERELTPREIEFYAHLMSEFGKPVLGPVEFYEPKEGAD